MTPPSPSVEQREQAPSPGGETSTATFPARPSRIPGILRALEHRNFRLFVSGQLISLIGTWMQNVAESWLIYRLTGSALLLGTVGFASQIPIFVLSPLGGIVADRRNRQRIVMCTQAASMILALTLATLTLLHVIRVWEVIVLAALLGAVNAFDIPARQSFIVEMVSRDNMMNAIALNSSMFNGARVVGPAIAGLLVASIGEGWCFLLNGVSYLAVLTGLLMMHLRSRPVVKHERSPVEDILEGFHFVAHTGPMRALLLLIGLVSLVGLPYIVLMPIFADQILHGGVRGLGMLMGATGVGALGGALALAMRKGMRGLSKVVTFSAAGFGVSLAAFAMSRWFWVSMMVLVPAGFCMMLQMAATNTLIQAMVPDRLRGRTMSVYSMMIMGMAPMGALGAGAAAHKLGSPLTVAIGGVICALGAGVFALHFPKLRGEARELIVAQAMAGGEPPDGMTVGSVK
jgi:MFS family permease